VLTLSSPHYRSNHQKEAPVPSPSPVPPMTQLALMAVRRREIGYKAQVMGHANCRCRIPPEKTWKIPSLLISTPPPAYISLFPHLRLMRLKTYSSRFRRRLNMWTFLQSGPKATCHWVKWFIVAENNRAFVLVAV